MASASTLADIDPSDGGREFTPTGDAEAAAPASVPTVLTKLQKWGNYESVAREVVAETRFLPMKTPLSEEILSNWSLPEAPKHSLTVHDLLLTQSRLGRHIGLILDLSNHDCLYVADLPPLAAAEAAASLSAGNGDSGAPSQAASSAPARAEDGASGLGLPPSSAEEYQRLQYRHIKLVAKELPAREFVTAVVHTVDAFWAQHPNQYIAIHCAYGFNRTGFVVCCYLIERRGMTVDQALAAFATARPPGVKHEQFRAELRARYELAPLQPPLAAESEPCSAAGHQHQEQHASPPPPPPQQLAGVAVLPGGPPWSPTPHTPAAATAVALQHLQMQALSSGGTVDRRVQSLHVFASYQREHLAEAVAAVPRTPHEPCSTPAAAAAAGPCIHHPHQQLQAASGGARLPTPMSENDSLGFTDRVALQTLRAQHLAAATGKHSSTPLDDVLEYSPQHPAGPAMGGAVVPSGELVEGESLSSSPQSICTPKSMSASAWSSALGRKSLGNIVWTMEDGDAAAPQGAVEGRRASQHGQASSSAGSMAAPSPHHWPAASAGGAVPVGGVLQPAAPQQLPQPQHRHNEAPQPRDFATGWSPDV